MAVIRGVEPPRGLIVLELDVTWELRSAVLVLHNISD